jgi:hypothetical protein
VNDRVGVLPGKSLQAVKGKWSRHLHMHVACQLAVAAELRR